MATAVSLWSPVIITGRTPARLHRATASLTSARGGSIRPTRPTKVRSRSSSSGAMDRGGSRSSRWATARTRRAPWAIRAHWSWTRRRSVRSRGRVP